MERESEDNNYKEEAKRTTEGGNQAERKTDGGGRGNITSRVEASRSQVQASSSDTVDSVNIFMR